MAWKFFTSSGQEKQTVFTGQEFIYNELTAAVTGIAGTTVGTATTVLTSSAYTFDGVTPVVIEFYTPWILNSTANFRVLVEVFEDATDLGSVHFGGSGGAGAITTGGSFKRRRTPSAGSHTYTVKGWVPDGGTGQVGAGAGGVGNPVPGFIRVNRAN